MLLGGFRVLFKATDRLNRQALVVWEIVVDALAASLDPRSGNRRFLFENAVKRLRHSTANQL